MQNFCLCIISVEVLDGFSNPLQINHTTPVYLYVAFIRQCTAGYSNYAVGSQKSDMTPNIMKTVVLPVQTNNLSHYRYQNLNFSWRYSLRMPNAKKAKKV